MRVCRYIYISVCVCVYVGMCTHTHTHTLAHRMSWRITQNSDQLWGKRGGEFWEEFRGPAGFLNDVSTWPHSLSLHPAPWPAHCLFLFYEMLLRAREAPSLTVQGEAFQATLLGFESWTCHFLPVWPWPRSFVTRCLSFLICQLGWKRFSYRVAMSHEGMETHSRLSTHSVADTKLWSLGSSWSSPDDSGLELLVPTAKTRLQFRWGQETSHHSCSLSAHNQVHLTSLVWIYSFLQHTVAEPLLLPDGAPDAGTSLVSEAHGVSAVKRGGTWTLVLDCLSVHPGSTDSHRVTLGKWHNISVPYFLHL